MKKYFVITDVHSFYDEMLEALNKAGFDRENPDHILVSCGDLFDRGQKPRECLEYIMSLPKERRALVCGNHEDNLMDLLAGVRAYDSADMGNGTLNTILLLAGQTTKGRKSLERLSECRKKLKEDKMLQEYFSELKDYYEIDNYIFVHGWIPWDIDATDPDHQKMYYIRDVPRLWKDARWECGFMQWYDMKYYAQCGCTYEESKTIVCGHWHTSFAHARIHNLGYEFPEDGVKLSECHFEPFIDDGIIGLDACTALTGKCNCYVIEEG